MMKSLLTMCSLLAAAAPASADLSELTLSTPYTGDTSWVAKPSPEELGGSVRTINADTFGVALLGQSTLGGAGFLSTVDGPGIYDGVAEQVTTSLVQTDTHSAFEVEIDNPSTQPLASKQIQVWFGSDNGIDLVPAGFTFTSGNPIDLYRIDMGMGAVTDTLNPGEGTFDIIDAFFVTFDALGTQLGAFNMINGQPAGTMGATDLFDVAIFPAPGDGVTDVAMIWNITPEPGSLAILAMGGVAVIRRARRRD